MCFCSERTRRQLSGRQRPSGEVALASAGFTVGSSVGHSRNLAAPWQPPASLSPSVVTCSTRNGRSLPSTVSAKEVQPSELKQINTSPESRTPLGCGGVKKRVWLWKAALPLLPVNSPLVGGLGVLFGRRLGGRIPSGLAMSLNSAATKSSTCILGGREVFCLRSRKISWGRATFWPNPPRPPRPRGAGRMWALLAGSM